MINFVPEEIARIVDEEKWQQVILKKKKMELRSFFSKKDLLRGEIIHELYFKNRYEDEDMELD